MQPSGDDPVYRNGLREALVALGAWAVCACYSLTYCCYAAYDLKAEQLKVVWGIPQWIVVGILLPWMVALAFAWWYCFRWIRDDDLGVCSAADEIATQGDQQQEN